jgi:hypothetical protein
MVTTFVFDATARPGRLNESENIGTGLLIQRDNCSSPHLRLHEMESQ